jgi:hypothetical protein
LNALKDRAKKEKLAAKNSINLLRVRPRVVTCPKVEQALVLWHQSMEAKGESVSGAMLMSKRDQLENMMNIPEEQRLGTSSGWVQNFCKMCVPIFI